MDQSMFIKRLNELSLKNDSEPRLRRIDELKLNKKYRIQKAESIETKYGFSILLTFDNCKVFLPKRYNKFQNMIEKKDFEGLSLIYKGENERKGKYEPKDNIEFI